MRDDHSFKRKSGVSVTELLHQLSSANAGTAWVEFLDRYAQIIMNTANQFEFEQDRINECFLFVCEKLNDDGFRRLLKFNTSGKAKFRTWLGSVVFNLCVDWHRQEYGRVRMLPAIAALPAFDQSVYRLSIDQGMSKEECFQQLRMDFPDLDREAVDKALGRIYSLLTPRQCWQISVRTHRRKHAGGPKNAELERLIDPAAEPDVQTQSQQELEELQKALSRLPTQQRLLLYLRFQEGLSLKKIAQMQNLGDSSRVWRHIKAAKNALFDHLRKINPADQQKN